MIGDMKYYGPQTTQALANFPFPYHKVDTGLVHAIAEVKKAVYQTLQKTDELEFDIAEALLQACDEILDGRHDTQFPLCALQGGAGTSLHMNVNEVLAARAQEILTEQNNQKSVHPNDHANLGQSTNDVNPTALRILCIRLTEELIETVRNLEQTFTEKAQQYAHVPKLGRTHIQDAVPTTVGEEMNAYAAIMKRNAERISAAKQFLYSCNLGGTAIGNGINASSAYRQNVYSHLAQVTHLPLQQGENLMAGTSSATDFCQLSSVVYAACTDVSKIAKDIRVLASGPRGGIGEFSLKSLQPGSSIMPGKVNPVLPEAVNQLYYMATGLNVTIHQAAHGANLELNVMFPIIADAVITMLRMSQSVFASFTTSCVKPLEINEERCKENLERSTAYATLLTPVLGYDVVSRAVKRALQDDTSIRQVLFEQGTMTEEEFEEAVRR
jgi:aspartate ammonia-lyase